METPEWFDQAIMLRAQGKTVREIADALNVSHTLIWEWTTPQGEESRKKQKTAAFRAKRAKYMRAYRARTGRC